LTASETQAIYVTAGYLLYGRDGQLVRQQFGVDARELSGDAVPVVDRLRSNFSSAYGDFTASNTGVLAYRSGLDASNQFTWVSRKGTAGATVGPPGRYRNPALSPDSRWLAYADSSDGNLKLLDVQRGFVNVLTSEPGVETAPVWAAGGTRVFYRSDSGNVFMKDVKSTSAPVQ
jgi:hypothetical protein